MKRRNKIKKEIEKLYAELLEIHDSLDPNSDNHIIEEAVNKSRYISGRISGLKWVLN